MNFNKAEVELSNRVFILGPNASGKSNFLDVFRFLRDVARSGGGLESAVQKRGGVSKVRSLHAKKNPSILIDVDVEIDSEKWRYIIEFSQDGQKRPILKSEKIFRDGEILLERPLDDDNKDPELLRQTALEQVAQNREFRELAAFFSSTRYYHVVPQLIRDAGRIYSRGSVGPAVDDPFGADFLEKLSDANDRVRSSRLRRMSEVLALIVPNLSDLEFERDSRGHPHLKAKFRHWRPQGGWQTEEQFSDGTLRFIGLIWSLMEGGGPLLLEEPELSLHPAVVSRLPHIFAKVQSDRKQRSAQIILTTHSATLLNDQGIDLSEVLVLEPGGGGVSMRSAAEYEVVRDLVEAGDAIGDALESFTRPDRVEGLSTVRLSD